MKNKILAYTIFSCLVLVSCKKENEASKKVDETPVSVTCYQAVFEKDTATLKVNTLKDGSITGDLIMKEFEVPIKEGTIAGKFSGDTLLVDYSYLVGPTDKTIFKNPLALLKKGNELILGNGKIETYLGKTYFVKGQPIDYEKVKYKFKTVDCNE
ncbi:hypothetical protein BXU11_16670 [Flavobacterium sp. LM5]|jgi:hypothetical protein|uniref:hypothetical protein n=1 Tax=Flavobacterium sp. LM5 TaxID=1938610 RepID=UPI0009929D3F|nr:hypothetical protein [Flavobacterium sp. LM5]OOV21726.1 hypothetical protein BXU11_16670 [Flavobacterium sp. LM5]